MAAIYRVYLSSTLKDLGAERETVKKVLSGECVTKDSYRASENELIETCLDDVGKCDIYVGIVGLRYGYRPEDGQKNPGNKSITELEYEKAIAAGMPRLIFVKDPDSIAHTFTDHGTKEKENQKPDGSFLIDDFRARVSNGKEQVPAAFKTADDLGTQVLKSFMDFKTRREGGGSFFKSALKHPGELDHEIAVIFASGTDDAEYQAMAAITSRRAPPDKRFLPVDLSPDHAQYQSVLDPYVRRTRTMCWTITPHSLSRYKQNPQMLSTVLQRIECRTGGRYALLLGVTENDLPPDWRFDAICQLPSNELRQRTADSVEMLYRFVRERCPDVAPDDRIGLPCVTLALKADEASALANEPEKVYAGLSNTLRAIRLTQLRELMEAVGMHYPQWPEGFYGVDRTDWHPFTPAGESCATFLKTFVDELNIRRSPGTQEARLLGSKLIQLKHYAFDEFADDQYGSKAVLNTLRDQGCLVLVDEFALMHPKLRPLAEEFLNSQRAAIVSTIPGDPLSTPLATLIEEFSHLQVGTLLTRFLDTQDHRVEIAVNTPQRLSRWLRLVLPGLVTTVLAGTESRADLVQRPDTELFGTST